MSMNVNVGFIPLLPVVTVLTIWSHHTKLHCTALMHKNLTLNTCFLKAVFYLNGRRLYLLGQMKANPI